MKNNDQTPVLSAAEVIKRYSAKALLICSLLLLNISSFAQNWDEVIKAVASDREAGDEFGWSVSISGNYAIVGAYMEDQDTTTGGNTRSSAGSAYFFERDNSGTWNEVQKIVASDRVDRDWFGRSVSISVNYAIVGASQEAEDAAGGNTLPFAGSAYIFERDTNGIWNEVQKIVASDRAAFDKFGRKVFISGNCIIVGVHWQDEDTTAGNSLFNAGSAYIFERDSSGIWKEVQKIVASDRGDFDHFGWSVSISGNYAIVGANQEDEDTTGGNTLSLAGSAYIFERDSSGIWKEVQKIVSSDRGANDKFGWSVSISGNYVLVGAVSEYEDTTGGNALPFAGSAYFFERDSSGIWKEVQKIVASDRGASDGFGSSVSISGNYTIVGAINEDEDTTGGNFLIDAGSAYIFERDSSGIWKEVQKIVASDRGAIDFFGNSVSISGDYALVGALYEDEDSIGGNTLFSAGSAYIFELCFPTTSSFFVTACDSYTVPSGDETYTTSQTVIDTISNTAGCDSVITIIVNINNGSTSSFSVSSCDSYTVPSGDETYTTSQTVMDTISNAVGCDSVMTITVNINNSSTSSFSVTTCKSYTVPSGNKTYTTSQTILDTIPNAAGCDSVMTIAVNINNNSTNSFSVTACDSYAVPSGDETYTTSQTVMDTIPNAAGCDSVMTISLTINTADVSVTNKPPTLTANATGASYQWLYCDSSFAIISSDTNQVFTATTNGSYAVEITENGCIDTSTCYTIVNVGIVENSFVNELLVYPNPTKGNFLIDLGATHQLITVSITDLSGKLIYNNTYKQTQLIKLEINEPTGVYFITLESEGESTVIKLLKD